MESSKTQMFDSQNISPGATPSGKIPRVVTAEELVHDELQKHLIHEYEEVSGREDLVIANKLIRGVNQNTELTIKVKHGIEHLHRKVTPIEKDVAQLKEYRIAAEKVADALVKRNEIVDGYLKIISSAATWVKEKVGWWLLKLIQLITIGIAYLLVDYIFTHYLHTPLPRSIAPSP
jgi:hypothetical protein